MSASPLRVLIVDDDAGAAGALMALLKCLGHIPQLALDGRQGLDLLPVIRPDIAFVDIEMPGMDGYEVANRIRESPDVSVPLLVAFTASEEFAANERLHSTFDARLPKPFRLEALKAVLETAIKWLDD